MAEIPNSPVDPISDLDQIPHSKDDISVLYRIYMEKRIQAQIDFYESRVRENQYNADITFGVGAFVMTLSSLVATISASSGGSPALSVIAAVLPAFAALLASFRQLYSWERQSNIYRDALMGLERVRLLAPDDDRMSIADLTRIYPRLVTGGETVFTAEVNQWGQFIQNKDKLGAEDAKDAASIQSMVANFDLTDEQRQVIASIVSTGKPESAGQSGDAKTTSDTRATIEAYAIATQIQHSDLMDSDRHLEADAPAADAPAAPMADEMPLMEQAAVAALPDVDAAVAAAAALPDIDAAAAALPDVDAPPPEMEHETALAPGAEHAAPPPTTSSETEDPAAPTSAG